MSEFQQEEYSAKLFHPRAMTMKNSQIIPRLRAASL